jgi:hypothetical protein
VSFATQSEDLVPDSRTIAATGSEVILAGPGMLEMDAELQTGLSGQFDAAALAKIWMRRRAPSVEKPIDAVQELEPDQSAEQKPGTPEVHRKLKEISR